MVAEVEEQGGGGVVSTQNGMTKITY
jgi:hypothetical protein